MTLRGIITCLEYARDVSTIQVGCRTFIHVRQGHTEKGSKAKSSIQDRRIMLFSLLLLSCEKPVEM